MQETSGRLPVKAYKGEFNMTEETQAVDTQEEVDTQNEPTVKVAEMKRRIEQEQKKAQEQIDAMNQTLEQRIADEVAKAQELAKLNGKELEDYKQKNNRRNTKMKSPSVMQSWSNLDKRIYNALSVMKLTQN